MTKTIQTRRISIDSVLSALVIAVAFGFAGYSALSSVIAPLAA
jgi:hypothetical protein